MAVVHAKQKSPSSVTLKSLATLINELYGVIGATMLTAVQAATTIATLRSGIAALNCHAKYKDKVRHLERLLQDAYDQLLFGADASASNTAIAALTTINTASASTDLLYLLATTNSAALNSTTYGHYEISGQY